MCNFLFRMQQHNFENHQFAQQNHQFAQQRTIERLELENFIHLRQVARNNQLIVFLSRHNTKTIITICTAF